MPTVCIQCALEHLVNTGQMQSDGHVFEETPEEHMKRMHPKGVDPKYRQELEQKAAMIIKNLVKNGEK